MATTQKQIAQHLNLSQTTVAQALNDYASVAPATRALVQETAREMGYGAHSNAAARALVARRYENRRQTGTIAVLMGSFSDGLLLRDVPFFQPLLRGIEYEAIERKLELCFCIAPGEHLPRLVAEQGVDGVMSLYSRTANDLLLQRNVTLPTLCVGDAWRDAWSLMPDNFEGALRATRHLIELGHHRIAYLGMLSTVPPQFGQGARLEGYLQALKEGGVAVANELIETHLNASNCDEGAASLQRVWGRTREVSALVCYNDLVAIGAMRQAQQMGLRVPDDLSVVGFDDTAEATQCAPQLTTIRFDRLQMGRRAVQLLCEVNPTTSLPTPSELLSIELIIRDSTGHFNDSQRARNGRAQRN